MRPWCWRLSVGHGRWALLVTLCGRKKVRKKNKKLITFQIALMLMSVQDAVQDVAPRWPVVCDGSSVAGGWLCAPCAFVVSTGSFSVSFVRPHAHQSLCVVPYLLFCTVRLCPWCGNLPQVRCSNHPEPDLWDDERCDGMVGRTAAWLCRFREHAHAARHAVKVTKLQLHHLARKNHHVVGNRG